MADIEITLTVGAAKTIARMVQRVEAIGNVHGHMSEEYINAMQSLLVSLNAVFQLGGRVTKDDELSLLVQSFIVVGVIFHPRYIDGVRDELVGTWQTHS